MVEKGRARKMLLVVFALSVLVWAAVSFMNARWVGGAAVNVPEETAAELKNPDQGFYYIHGFVLKEEMDCAQAVSDSFAWDTETGLSLVEFNLRHFGAGPIPEGALENLQTLFDLLREMDRHYIVRFVYDWDGRNMEVEPTRIETVQQHMRQVAGLVNANKDRIYTLQGLFVGNWGEMNGTRYTGRENWKALFGTLAEVTDRDLFLAVRMPAQWRCATEYTQAPETLPSSGSPAARLGLFNDGMMGSESDLGTYGTVPRAQAEYYGLWSRADELAFQEELCRWVPNGGEVVYDTEFNDFTRAVETLRTMHVSYLNRDYDRSVYRKWEAVQVDGGLWDGVDGLTYIQRHLGYRFVVEDAALEYRFWRNELEARVELSNVGFAPVYHQVTPQIVLLDGNGRERYCFPLEGDITALSGGRDDGTLTLTGRIPAGEVTPGDYRVCFRLWSEKYQREILLANARRQQAGGTWIASVEAK